MNDITHKQALQWIDRQLDGLLSENQLLALNEHLKSCDSCRTYATNMDGLSAHLQNEFRRRWDETSEPSQNIVQQVTAKARKIPLANRISSGAKLLTGAMALIMLAVAINFVVSRLERSSAVANATEIVDNATRPEERLLAFTSKQSGNSDIYTVHADGSGLTNITNHPAYDGNPFWSSDGKRIAFEREQDGFTQIYLMDADGSNVTQLTRDEAHHSLPINLDGISNPWSPDGSKLLFLQLETATETSTLYSIDIHGENKVRFDRGKISGNGISWSPNGKYVGYVINTSDTTFTPEIYVADSTGSNVITVSELLPEIESLHIQYYWSQGGNSLIFTARRHFNEGQDQWVAYEARLTDAQAVEKATSSGVMEDWWDGTSFIRDLDGSSLRWLRADGTFNTLNPMEICQSTEDTPHAFIAKRSSNGSQIVNVVCPNDEMRFYYVNSDATIIKPLLDSPIPAFAVDNAMTNMTWSPDDQFIAITLTSTTKSSLHILNLNDNSKTEEIVLSEDEFYTVPSWQPMTDENLAKEDPTPQPKSTPSGLLAFTSDQNGNFDIYTMYPDGSMLTNITNNPAVDMDPFWSPDGRRIAFTSGRDGSSQIYLMDADGSDVIQLTSGEDSRELARSIQSFSPWSPDGSKLLFLESPPGEEKWKLYVMDANGENKTPLVQEPNTYGVISWSPDGQHIALIADDPQNLGGDRIYVVDADGSNLRELTKSLQPSEQLFAYNYLADWSPDSQSIFFIAFFQKPDPYWTAYEARLDDLSLIAHAKTNDIMYGWGNDIYLVNYFSYSPGASAAFEWVRPDGTTTVFNPHEKCLSMDPHISGDYVMRSPHGNWVLMGNCSNSDTWFYWANSDGSIIKPLVDSAIPLTMDQMSTISWSPDDQFITFTISSPDFSELYILNVSEARNDRLIPPIKIAKSYGVSWQPVANQEIVHAPTPTPEPTPIVESEPSLPIGTGINNGEWIAIIGSTMVSEPTSSTALTDSRDVYLVHPDGSGLVNITNSPEFYYWPIWSPNGENLLFLRDAGTIEILRKTESNGFEVLVSTEMKEVNGQLEIPGKPFEYSWSPNSQQIAFLDNRAGNYDIYTIYADGRSDPQLKPLTNDPGEEFGFVWSPDGTQIAYQTTNGDQLSVMVMEADGSNQQEVARGAGELRLRWSLDGTSIYASSTYGPPYGLLACKECATEPGIYQIDLDGPSVHQIYFEEDAEYGWVLYDAPQNELYFTQMHFDGLGMGMRGLWKYWDGSSIQEIGAMDPRQTCKTTTGNIWNEHIAPNERFSIITNFCAGGFDLYLADREAATPEKRLTHLLQLPLDTLGVGGNDAYLPMVWSPDGHILVYSDDRGTYFLDIEKALQDPDAALTRFMEPSYYTGSDGLQYQSSETITVWSLVWQPSP